jgi:protein-tyrosine-phosphatase
VKNLLDRLRQAQWRFALSADARREDIRNRLPRPVSRVLVLCKGNICRSPFAAELLAKRAADRDIRIEIRSAGLETSPGHDAHPFAKRASREFGVHLDLHKTTPISPDMVSWADLILVMEPAHMVQLRVFGNEGRAKAFLLGHFSPRATNIISDPFAGTMKDFRRCYAIIDDACDGLLALIAARPSGAPAR